MGGPSLAGNPDRRQRHEQKDVDHGHDGDDHRPGGAFRRNRRGLHAAQGLELAAGVAVTTGIVTPEDALAVGVPLAWLGDGDCDGLVAGLVGAALGDVDALVRVGCGVRLLTGVLGLAVGGGTITIARHSLWFPEASNAATCTSTWEPSAKNCIVADGEEGAAT